MAPRTFLANLHQGCPPTPGVTTEAPVAPPKRTTPLQRHEINEAGYLAGRAALADPIDDPQDLRRQVAGNETSHEARSGLHIGRGNVYTDIEASAGSSTFRTLTAKVAMSRKDLGGADKFERRDAAALALGAGNCDHYGTIAARLHGPRLKDGETVHVVGSDTSHHTWAEIRTPGQPSVTVDPWSNGPAMQTSDTVWGEQHRIPDASFNAQTGTAARNSLLKLAQEFEHGPKAAVLARQLNKFETERPNMEFEPWVRSTQLAGQSQPDYPGFGESVRNHMERLQPEHQEILAVGAARSAYDMTIPAAVSQARAIFDAAQTLDTMPDALARPPRRDPDTPR